MRQLLVDHVPANDVIDRMELAGPGFINVYLQPRFLSQRITRVLQAGPAPPAVDRARRVVIDYSSPNIAKDMHVGHLRSTIIGDALARVLEFCGHEVDRVNHVGDWGTQFGMLIAHLKDTVPDVAADTPSITDLTKLYRDAKARYDAEPDFNHRAHQEVVALQAGDATNLALWRQMCQASERMMQAVYQRLGVDERLHVVGESFYNPYIPPLLHRLQADGLLQELSAKDASDDRKPAQGIAVPGHEVPLILRKSDGGVGYDSTDMAALDYRVRELGADWLVYVVDAGQSLHFELLFKGAAMARLHHPDRVRLDHVSFGVVLGADRKRLKTRSGETVRLVDLLDEARDRALAQLQERAEGDRCQVGPEEMRKAAESIGYGSVKYFDLKQHRGTDYVFDYDRMLSPDGDTNVYLQYAHARICSILRKAADSGVDVDALLASGEIQVQQPQECALATELLRLSEVVALVASDLCPHRLCGYLYNLSIKFTDFYMKNKVLGSPEQDSRLRLCHVAALTMRKCMELLGIVPVFRI